ncbi:MmcB family DNA repair protein [Komagataeibacter rhaeticus]|nr:MmcB family DNA repair protein [Komagataeibacter rhaeticus]
MDCALIRPAPHIPLAPARRRSLTLRFAMQAAERLGRTEMPQLDQTLRTALRVE